MHINKTIILIVIFILTGLRVLPQSGNESFDTIPTETNSSSKYYINLDNQFLLRIYSIYKSNNVDISKDGSTLKFRPNGPFSIGLGFNYKFIGLGISYGAPVTKQSKDKYGNTQRLDLQFSVISKSFGVDAHLQAYKGYYISNPGDFINWNEKYYPQLPDMRVLTLGLNAFYLFNGNKFSYRAAFKGNQIQKKSAGSIAAGLFGTFDEVRTDNGFVPKGLVDSTDVTLDLKSFQAFTIGVSVGYMYTFVIKQGFFISLAGVPGIGYRHYQIKDIDNKEDFDNQLTIHLAGKIAIGYNWKKYMISLNTNLNLRNYKYKSYELSMSTEHLKLTFAIRFQTKASKKRNQYYFD